MPKNIKKQEKEKGNLEFLKIDEESVPLHFANLVRMHTDALHSNLVFAYLRPGKKEKGAKAEPIVRVALPLGTLVSLHKMIGRILNRMEKDGVLEYDPQNVLISEKKE